MPRPGVNPFTLILLRQKPKKPPGVVCSAIVGVRPIADCAIGPMNYVLIRLDSKGIAGRGRLTGPIRL